MKIKKKVYFIFGIILITFISVIGINILRKIDYEKDPEILRSRAYKQVTAGDENIEGTEFVKFNAFFLRDIDKDGTAEMLLGTCRNLEDKDSLYMELNVLTEGHLENAKITINGTNFKLKTEIVSDKEIKKDYVSQNTKLIEFNNVNSGTQKLIIGEISPDLKNNINDYTAESTITLTGTHVADDGVTKTEIQKTIPLTVDWHGKNETVIENYCLFQANNLENLVKNEENFEINAQISVRDEINKLLIKSSVVEGQVPQFMGYDPLDVTCEDEFVEFSYDKQNRTFLLKREAAVDENGNIIKNVSRTNLYNIKIKYPIEAYEQVGGDAISISIPIVASYNSFNNQNEEFSNPYTSKASGNIGVSYRRPRGENARVEVEVGELIPATEGYNRFVSKELPLNIYNELNEEVLKEDEYLVKWYAYTGTDPADAGLLLENDPEQKNDIFINKDGTSLDMSKYVKNVGIYFRNARELLGDNGWIKIYNAQTDELVQEFNIEEIEKYNSSKNRFVYDTPLDSIYIKTSKYNANANMYFYNIKEIDDALLVADFSKEEFENIEAIKSTIMGSMIFDSLEVQKINTELSSALYMYPESKVEINVDKEWISTQREQEDVNITINTISDYKNQSKWKDGIYLIKFPKEIINVGVNSVSSAEVTIDSYEVVELDDECIGIKIYTSNNEGKIPSIKVNVNIACNPLVITQNIDISLYSENGMCKNYSSATKDIYDINYNLNTEENISYSQTKLRIISPTTLIISQNASEYDNSGDITIAPKIANIEKRDGEQSAKITVDLFNNYNSTITDVKMIGKIPKIDNTYPINGKTMKSEFDTILQDSIAVPEELKDIVKIYYSYNDRVNTDIYSNANDWKNTVEDYSKVKSYMIDFGDYTIENGKNYSFSYNLGIDTDAKLNQISYANHAVYFALNTDEGKYNTQTEPNKLGLKLIKRFNLELSKFEKDSEKLIPNTLYRIQNVNTKESKTAVTDENGKLKFDGLYTGVVYSLKEIRANENYVNSNNEVKFVVNTQNSIDIDVTILSGELKNTPIIDNTTSTVAFETENEIKYNFELNKSDDKSNEKLSGVKFMLNGGGYINRIFSTNSQGILNVNGLIPGNIYTLRETEANGYYIRGEEIEFKVERSDGKLQLVILSGNFVNNPTISTKLTDDRPIVSIDYSNEKIPTYNFELQKVKQGTTDPIKGVKFVLSGPNKKERVYETDINGLIQLNDLYVYDDTRDQDATYTLREIYAPEGYVVNTDTIEFSVKKNSDNTLEINKFTENDGGVKYSFNQEENKMIITFPNAPSLKIIKTDADTHERMSNVEFEVYDEFGKKIPTGSDIVQQEIEFDNFYGEKEWEKNHNGEWYVENVYGSSSQMTYGVFAIDNPTTLSFEWIPEISDSNGYLYVTIGKFNTNDFSSFESTAFEKELSGIKYNGMIDKNQFESEEVNLDPGYYAIGFEAEGVDKAIVKNVRIGNIPGTTVITDENGEANVNMPEGKYILKEKYVSGYQRNNKQYKVGIGKSYNKIKALEFEDSEIVSEESIMNEMLYANSEKKEVIDLGNGFYYQEFVESYLDKNNNILAVNMDSETSALVYRTDTDGNITSYKSFEDDSICPELFFATSDGCLVYNFEEYTRIDGEENYRDSGLCKYDTSLNEIKYSSSSCYSSIAVIKTENGFEANFEKGFWGDTEIFDYNVSGLNGRKYVKVVLDENLNVTSLTAIDNINIDMYGNKYGDIKISSEDLIGTEILGYTIDSEDINKTLMFEIDKNNIVVFDKYDNISFSEYKIKNINDDKIVMLEINDDCEIKGENFESGSVAVIKYDSQNKYTSTQKISGARLESYSDEYIIDDNYYYLLYVSGGKAIINDSIEVDMGENNYILVQYGIDDGKILGYYPIKNSEFQFKKINEEKFLFCSESSYRENINIILLDKNLNEIISNEITMNSVGQDWIDNIIVLDDNSIVMTYNIIHSVPNRSLGSEPKKILDSLTSHSPYENKWNETYLLKYNSDGDLIFIKPVNDLETNIIKEDNNILIIPNMTGRIMTYNLRVDQTNPHDTKYILYGYTNSNEEIKEEGINKITYHEVDTYEYPETVVLNVKNTKKKHNVYTDYNYSSDFRKGMITGFENEEYYNYEPKKVEDVVEGQNSQKDIVITPYEGFKISQIRIKYGENSEDGDFNYYYDQYIVPDKVNADGSYVLDKFEDVDTCILIEVSFEEIEAQVQVNHYIKGTEIRVAPSDLLEGKVDEEYITSPHADLGEYELEKDENGDYILPDNKIGKYTEEKQIVNYYYVKKAPRLIVHHYLEGTEYKLAEDEIIDVNYNDSYTTNRVSYPTIDERYDLVSSSENTSGIIENSVTEVIYYYNTAHHVITTSVDGFGGNITGNGTTKDNPYEVVPHGKNSQKDIEIVPDKGYVISSITINGEEIELPQDINKKYVLSKFENMTEDKHIVVAFEPDKILVKVKKTWNDEDDINGKRPDRIQVDIYNDNELIDSTWVSKYEDKSVTDDGSWKASGYISMINEDGSLLDVNKLHFVETEINVNDLEFYNSKVSQTYSEEDKILNVVIENTYRVPEETLEIEVTKKWVDNNNENSKRPSQIKLQIRNGEEIVKETILDVTNENEQSYIFRGLQKYDEKGNEIEYTIDETEVNSEDLKFYSKEVNQNDKIVTNTFTVPEDKITIAVTKKWEDVSNENSTRPSQIKLQIKNGKNIVQEQVVNCVTDSNTQTYEFKDLAKYDLHGDEIVYTIDEVEVNENDLIGYSKAIDNENYVITNTILQHKVTTEVKGIGGDITGKDDNPYEVVNHAGTSIKDIVITPEYGYEVAKITINDVEQSLPDNVRESYMLDKFNNVIEDIHVVVEFKKQQHKITTEVNGEGGDITGKNDNPYETVIHGENSQKDIKVTPEYGYVIDSIIINGENLEFVPNKDKTYELNKFINMTEDKHIVVKFRKMETSVVVRHVIKNGEELIDLINPEEILGVVGQEYKTKEKEFEAYEIETIPENANGSMTEERIEVVYIYNLVTGKITINKVDKKDNTKLLSGAIYQIEQYDKDGNIISASVQQKTTDTNGKVEFTDLPIGKYKITEIKSPNGYELSKEPIEVEINKEQRELNIIATDNLKLELPITGKKSYVLHFIVAGIVIIMCAIALGKKQKKKLTR